MSENVPNRPAARSAGNRRPATPGNTRAQAQPRTVKDYLIMLRERWYWGLAGALLVGGTLYFMQMRKAPVYSAATTVSFENPVPVIVDSKNGGAYAGGEINLATYMERMQSGTFRAKVAASFTPEEAEKIRQPYLDPQLPPDAGPSVEEIVANAIEIVPRRESPILEITATHRDPVAAQLIANRFVQEYITFNRANVQSDSNDNLNFLQQKQVQLRQQLEEAQAKVQEFLVSHNEISVMGDSQNLVAQRLNAAANELIQARAALGDLQATLRQIEEYQKAGKDLLQLNYIAQFGSIPTILRDLDTLKADRSLLEQRYGENHPKMLANAQSIEAKNDALRDNVARAIAEIQSSVTKAKQHEQDIIAKQDKAEKDALDLQQNANTYGILKAEQDKFASLYADVARQFSELQLTVTLSNVKITVIDHAGLPWAPSDPNPRKILVQACLVGGFFLIAVPLALGVIDVRLKAAWEVEQFLNQNLIGEVPSISGVARKERAHIMAKDLDHTASEAFRGLFGHLQLNSLVPYPKVLMVTSTLPGEGKSMIANNLAATFASHGKKTLLVDCDFRRPNLHLYYGKDNACGVLRWLNAWNGAISGPLEEDQDLGILPVKQNLFLLRAGGEHRRATELFETEQFAKLVSTLRQQFDVVIIDTPPLGVFPDAMLVSRKCDEAIYVCRFNTVNRSKIRKSIDRLKKSEAVLAGVVLNGLPTGKQSAYYDYYGYGSNENKRYKAYYAQKR